MSQLGYIETSKGKGGGIRIAKSAEKLRLGDLIAELEPNMIMAECFDARTNTCRIVSSCKLKHYLFEATKNFTDTMNKYTLAEMIQNEKIPLIHE